MQQVEKAQKLYIWLFLLVQCALYIAVVFTKINSKTQIYYLSICFCFVTAFVLLQKNIDSILQMVALAFTVCADYILILTDGDKNVAICFFVLAQTAYCIRTLLLQNKKQQRQNLAMRLALSAILVVCCFVVLSDPPFFAVMAMVYFANLVANLVVAFCNYEKNKKLAIGLLLFLCCDVFVGLSVMEELLDLGSNAFFVFLNKIPFGVQPFFYIPSQTVLSLSAYKN